MLIIAVPEGPNPPYVHSSGRIYRRIADSSEPKAETDRAVLDTMWRKSEDLRNRMREFVFGPLESQRSEDTYCYVYLVTDPTLSVSEYDLRLGGFADAMRTGLQNSQFSITLDNMYATQDGYIARHLMDNNDPRHELASLRWWRNGNVRLTIPVHYVQSHDRLQDVLYKRFISAIHGHNESQILNMEQWLVVFTTLSARYLCLRDKIKCDDPIYGKVVFNNARLKTPFIGMDSFLKIVKEHGIPVCQDSVTTYPSGGASVFTLLEDNTEQDAFMRSFSLTLPLAFNGLYSLGVMFDTDIENSNSFGNEVLQAMERGAMLKAWITRTGTELRNQGT